MSLILRTGKGNRLSSADLDSNFVFLQDSINTIPVGPTGSPGSDGEQGPTGSPGSTGADGILQLAEFISVSMSNSGATVSSPIAFALQYNHTLGLSGSNVLLLNPNNVNGKTYLINVSFFIYNVANEAHSYRMKLNDNLYGLEVDLGQHGTQDFSYNLNSFCELVTVDTPCTLEFWRTTDNTQDPATQGFFTVHEIAGSGPQGATGAQGADGTNTTTNRVLTVSDNGATILESDSILFVSLSYSINVSLPNVFNMQGKTLTFIRTDNIGESSIQLNGPFVGGQSTYFLYGFDYNTVTLISDGYTWYKIAST